MRKMLAYLIVAVVTTGAAYAQDIELEIQFYLQPDSTGSNTENRTISLDGTEIEIEGHNADESVYFEREATADEIAFFVDLMNQQLAAIDLSGRPSLDYPYVEVEFEFDGGTVAVELEYDFAVGAVPAEFVDLQNRFFDGAFE